MRYPIAPFINSALAALARSDHSSGLPVHLTVEPANICQLHCPVCETGAGIMRRPRGMMSAQNFEKVLDNVGGQVNTVLLYWMGEPLLNKELPELVDSTRHRGIFTSICTNGELSALTLIEAGVSEISFQIGGLGQEAHSTYRVGGTWETVKENIQEAVVLAKRQKRLKTTIRVGFIVMKHNEHQVAEAVRRFTELGALVDVIKPCVRTAAQAGRFMPLDPKYWFYDRKAYYERLELTPRTVPHNRCWWIYFSTVVAWNGDVVPCCRDVQGDWVLGNALREDFRGIWNGEKAREFRRQIRRNQEEVAVCRLCSGYPPPLLRRYP